MKKTALTHSKRFAMFTALFAASLMPAASAAQGAINLGQEDYSTWALYGSASYATLTTSTHVYKNIVLTTPGTGGSAGAAFAPTPLTFDLNQPFSFSFPFFVAPGTSLRGDGMTFVLAASPGVGSGGSDLGYGGLNGVAFAIDTFNFSGEPVSPSLQILTGSTNPPLAYTETGLGDNVRDPALQWIANVTFTPSGNDDEQGTLTGDIWRPDFGTYSVSAQVDLNTLGAPVFDPVTNAYLGRSIYYGFTAANGLADDGHIVTSAVAVVPLPAAAWLLASGLIGLVGVARRKTA